MGEPIDPSLLGTEQQCFGCSQSNPAGMQLRFERDGDTVRTTFEPRPGWEGPPGIVHGGLQATLADEVAAWTLIGLLGRFGLTTSMQLRLYRPARIDRPIDAAGTITEHTDTSAVVKVTLHQDGKRVLSGTLGFAFPTLEMAEKLLGRPLLPEWRALARAT